MEFGERLKELRLKAGYTQAELAKMSNLTKSMISFYEHKDRSPSADIILRFAEIFNVTTDYLILGKNQSNDNLIDVTGLTPDEKNAIETIVKSMKGKKI